MPTKEALEALIGGQAFEFRSEIEDELAARSLEAIQTKRFEVGASMFDDEVVEEVELDEGIEKMTHSRLKWHMNTGVPHGSYTKDEMEKERDRRRKTGEGDAYKKAKSTMNATEG